MYHNRRDEDFERTVATYNDNAAWTGSAIPRIDNQVVRLTCESVHRTFSVKWR
jgi:hypothetical protein